MSFDVAGADAACYSEPSDWPSSPEHPPKFHHLKPTSKPTRRTCKVSSRPNHFTSSIMFCTRCLRASTLRRQLPIARQFSTSTFLRSAEPQLSTPVTAPGEQRPEAPVQRSSCPEGTVFAGLNYLKDGQDPVAKRDEEYPEWLWECLDVMKKKDSGDEDAGDEFCTEASPLLWETRLPPYYEALDMLTGFSLQQSLRSSEDWRPSVSEPWRPSSLPRAISRHCSPRSPSSNSRSTCQARRMGHQSRIWRQRRLAMISRELCVLRGKPRSRKGITYNPCKRVARWSSLVPYIMYHTMLDRN